jgi:hypothetical protein
MGVDAVQGVEQDIDDGIGNGCSGGERETGAEPPREVRWVGREGAEVMRQGCRGGVKVEELGWVRKAGNGAAERVGEREGE